jgi:hypothetical protein
MGGEALVIKGFVRDPPDWRTMRGMFRGLSLLKDLMDERAAEIARDSGPANAIAADSSHGSDELGYSNVELLKFAHRR